MLQLPPSTMQPFLATTAAAGRAMMREPRGQAPEPLVLLKSRMKMRLRLMEAPQKVHTLMLARALKLMTLMSSQVIMQPDLAAGAVTPEKSA